MRQAIVQSQLHMRTTLMVFVKVSLFPTLNKYLLSENDQYHDVIASLQTEPKLNSHETSIDIARSLKWHARMHL